MASGWQIRLSRAAETDFERILTWTRDRFGDHQFGVYTATLIDTLTALEHGPELAGSRARDEILPGVRTLHVARNGRRGRHFILYRVGHGQVIEVIRILHDAMELDRHVRPEPD